MWCSQLNFYYFVYISWSTADLNSWSTSEFQYALFIHATSVKNIRIKLGCDYKRLDCIAALLHNTETAFVYTQFGTNYLINVVKSWLILNLIKLYIYTLAKHVNLHHISYLLYIIYACTNPCKIPYHLYTREYCAKDYTSLLRIQGRFPGECIPCQSGFRGTTWLTGINIW